MNYKHFYQRFLQANLGKQHFACHSHYYWPDVTRDAMLDYWDDSARYVDEKWQYFFQHKVPALQQHIARHLNTGLPEQIVFAPNTHELLYRILTCFESDKPLRILTSDSEFHSFTRQSQRLAEAGKIELTKIPTQPFADFSQRFIQAADAGNYDLVFVSQVFYNSGVVFDGVVELVSRLRETNTLIVIDGYHGFMAMPIDLSAIADRVFFLAGGYKYAQGGEGGCFAHVPTYRNWRPEFTGWYAEFGALQAARAEQVQYASNGMSLAGATMDFAPLYRMLAVMDLFQQQQLSVKQIHQHIQQLQQAFLQALAHHPHPLLNAARLLKNGDNPHGHFLTFELDSPEQTAKLAAFLREQHILTDYRGNRLRFGFALYHDPSDYDFSCLEKDL